MYEYFVASPAPSEANAPTRISVADLASIVDSSSTCGRKLRLLADSIVATVDDIRVKTPGVSSEDIRATMSTLPIVLVDVPTATNACLREFRMTKTEETAYESRDVVRKPLGIFLDQLIETSTANTLGSLIGNEYVLEVSNVWLDILSMIDPTGLAYSMTRSVEPVYGLTEILGEIADGSLAEALGLKVLGADIA